MASQEPKRWAELGSDAPGSVQSLLNAARQDLPNQNELQAMGLIGGIIAPFDGGSDLVGPASKASPIGKATIGSSAGSSGSFAKLALLAKLGASGLVVAGGATWFLQSREPVADTPSAPAATVQVPSTQGAAPEARPLVNPPGLELTNEQSAAATEVPNVSANARSAAAGSPRPTPPASEASLLQRAQASLAKNPQRALALTEQHAKQFPAGQLTQEREVIRIEALRRLGRDNQAEKVGRDFERQFPDSPHRRKLDQSEP